LEALLEARKSPKPGAPDGTSVAKRALPDFTQVRLLVSDVDGVLTDGGMYYGSNGEAFKKFNTKDGLGIRKWLESGREFAVITGENSPCVHERMKKLSVKHYFPGVKDKGRVLRELASQLGLVREQIAYIGDDENDLSVLPEVGLFACPSDAAACVRASAQWICEREGGAGVVRELLESLLV
jgi:3-deoxy-D-manno-octulosonate 8-phosphate phosphatase (KDO 8-P phosphatase)